MFIIFVPHAFLVIFLPVPMFCFIFFLATCQIVLTSLVTSFYFIPPEWMFCLYTCLRTMHKHLVISYIQILIGWSSLNTLFVKCIWDHFTSSPDVNSFPSKNGWDIQPALDRFVFYFLTCHPQVGLLNDGESWYYFCVPDIAAFCS